MADELRNLELRIAKLENQLRQAGVSDDLSTLFDVQEALTEGDAGIKKCRLVEVNVFFVLPGGHRIRRFDDVTGTSPDVETPSEPEAPDGP